MSELTIILISACVGVAAGLLFLAIFWVSYWYWSAERKRRHAPGEPKS